MVSKCDLRCGDLGSSLERGGLKICFSIILRVLMKE